MLKIEGLESFFKANGFPADVPFAWNRRVHTPDRMVQLTEVSGPPMTDAEEAYDNAGVQMFFRSPRELVEVARDDAHMVDSIVLNDSIRPFSIEGFRVISCGRMGGGPSFWEIDQDDRGLYVCLYWFTTQR